MTTTAQKLHRLSDFVIEEVSLVDRAANKRRFLQVKRDDAGDAAVRAIEPDGADSFVIKASWSVGAAKDLTITEGAWDGAAAKQRIWAWAGFDGDNPDPTKARKAFLVYDADKPELKGSYKLPFADIVNGSLKAVSGGLQASASRLPQTQIPQAIKDSARSVLDGYFAKMNKRSITKGIEAVEEIFFAVGDAVDRLMRVASITLQAENLKIEPRPGADTVAAEIDKVQAVLRSVRSMIDDTKKALAKSDVEDATVAEAAARTAEAEQAVDQLQQLATHLAVRKAGAAMSAARLKRFQGALKTLYDLLGEVGGDTKSVTASGDAEKNLPAPAAKAAPEAVSAEVQKRLDEAEANVAALRKELTVLKQSPAPSQALPVENPVPVEEDFDWPFDMNQPLGPADVPVEKSFHAG